MIIMFTVVCNVYVCGMIDKLQLFAIGLITLCLFSFRLLGILSDFVCSQFVIFVMKTTIGNQSHGNQSHYNKYTRNSCSQIRICSPLSLLDFICVTLVVLSCIGCLFKTTLRKLAHAIYREFFQKQN